MRLFYRLLRRGFALLFVLGLTLGVIYYTVTTLITITDEIDEQRKINARNAPIAQTATGIAPTTEAESVELARFDQPQNENDGIEQDESPAESDAFQALLDPTDSVEVSATPQPSPTPTYTDTPEPTLTNTAIPSDTPTNTQQPSETPQPSSTPRPSNTPTDTEVPTEIAQNATLIPTNTLRPTLIPTNTPRITATFTQSPTATLSLTPTWTPTDTLTLTPTWTPTDTLTLTPTWTPTSTFTASPTLTPTTTPYPIEGTYATPIVTPIVNIPPRAALVEEDPNIINIVLMGSDTRGGNVGQTDVIILVSVNQEVGSVSMWHLPRDLLVYIPGYTVDRINRAFAVGIQNEWPGGGAGLMKETLEYNFGIEVDFYARVDFGDFERIISELGALEISIDCQLTDWALISPDLDPTVEENWEEYTLGIGRQSLSPYYALWYARSRVTTSDLDRGRRQIDILRAIWNQSQAAGILAQVTELWPEAVEIIDTDMELTDVLEFVPLANTLDISKIERFNGRIGVHFENYTTPDDGRSVLLPNWPALYQLARDFVTPPAGTRLVRSDVTVEIYDGSAFGIGFDLVAADRLAWEGFAVLPQGQLGGSIREVTLIYDYTGETKGSALESIMEILRVGDSAVIFEPDPNSPVDYRIEMGRNYNSCIYGSSADNIGPPIEEETDEDVETVG